LLLQVGDLLLLLGDLPVGIGDLLIPLGYLLTEFLNLTLLTLDLPPQFFLTRRMRVRTPTCTRLYDRRDKKITRNIVERISI
jgi:hypothetical protein